MTTIIYEDFVVDRQQEFIYSSLRDWAHGLVPWGEEAEQRREEEQRRREEQRREDEQRIEEKRRREELQQSHHDEEVDPFNLEDTTWAAAGSRLQAECAICLKDFEAEDMVSTIPCKHCFHQGCISQWLRVSCVCPLCRRAV
jgi:hypothetical protein